MLGQTENERNRMTWYSFWPKCSVSKQKVDIHNYLLYNNHLKSTPLVLLLSRPAHGPGLLISPINPPLFEWIWQEK